MVQQHDRKVVLEYAVALHQWKETKIDFNAVMRERFPGITDYMIRKAREDAKLLLAFRQTVNKERE